MPDFIVRSIYVIHKAALHAVDGRSDSSDVARVPISRLSSVVS